MGINVDMWVILFCNEELFSYSYFFNFCLLYFVGDTCLGPTLTSSKFYSTHEAQMSTDTVFIVEFTLSCKNGLRVRSDK